MQKAKTIADAFHSGMGRQNPNCRNGKYALQYQCQHGNHTAGDDKAAYLPVIAPVQKRIGGAHDENQKQNRPNVPKYFLYGNPVPDNLNHGVHRHAANTGQLISRK